MELVKSGFEAVITVVDTDRMDAAYLGRHFTEQLIDELEALGIDPCGEEGEFHTVVIDGPIFVEAVPVEFGDTVIQGNYHMLDVKLQTEE